MPHFVCARIPPLVLTTSFLSSPLWYLSEIRFVVCLVIVRVQYPPAAFSVKITHCSHQCKSAVFKGALEEIRATYYIQLQSCVITTGIRGVPISHCPGSSEKYYLISSANWVCVCVCVWVQWEKIEFKCSRRFFFCLSECLSMQPCTFFWICLAQHMYRD